MLVNEEWDASHVQRTSNKKGRKEQFGPYCAVWEKFASVYPSHFSKSKYITQFVDLNISKYFYE